MGQSANRKKRPPSIKDVAEMAGVSWSTVSNVIRGNPNVRPETQQRVKDAISALGYRTNSAGRQLRQGLSNMVVVAVPDLLNPQYATLVEALTHELHKSGLSTVLEITDGDPDIEKRVVEGRLRVAVDGGVLLPRGLTSTQIARLHTDVPLLLLGEGPGKHRFDTTRVDLDCATNQIVQHLTEQGCSDIVFVGHLSHHGNERRDTGLESFVRAIRQHGLGIGSGSIVTVDQWTREEGRDVALRMVGRGAVPQAIVCPDDLLALGLLRGFSEAEVRVPEDVRVVGFGGSVEGAVHTPTLTTVEVWPKRQAAAAASALRQRISDDTKPPADIVVTPSLRFGESSPVTS